jgi:hypothetical protein
MKKLDVKINSKLTTFNAIMKQINRFDVFILNNENTAK